MAHSIKTIEQARALPEIQSQFFCHTHRTLDTGELVCERTVRLLCGSGISGDDIILFTDVDGRTMKVVQTEDGPAKCELLM